MTHEIFRWENKIDHMIEIEEILPVAVASSSCDCQNLFSLSPDLSAAQIIFFSSMIV